MGYVASYPCTVPGKLTNKADCTFVATPAEGGDGPGNYCYWKPDAGKDKGTCQHIGKDGLVYMQYTSKHNDDIQNKYAWSGVPGVTGN